MMLDGRRRGNVGNAGTAGDNKSKTHDTVYHRTLGGAEGERAGKTRGGHDPNVSHKKTPVAKYLLAHAVLCVALICVSPLFYRSHAAHTAVRVRASLPFRLERRAAVLLDCDQGVRKAAQGALPEDRARGERDKKEE